MKKLMIAAAIVCAAVFTQAATYNWTCSPSGSTFNGYDGDAAIGTAWKSAVATAGMNWFFICADTITQSSLLKELQGGTDKLTTYALASGQTTANSTGINPKDFTADTGLTRSDGKMYGYLVIESLDSDYYYLSATASATANTEGGTAPISPSAALNTKKVQDRSGSAAFGSAGWYAVSVPEPTSGLLLVLGFAGLALRRKRA